MTESARLSPEEAAAVLERSRPIPTLRGTSPVEAVDLEGEGLDGFHVNRPLGTAALLLLFLSADCVGCDELFNAAATPPLLGIDDGDVLIVVREGDGIVERSLGAEVLISPSAFSDYRVQGTPFFSLVVPGRTTVATEGVAWGASGVKDAVERALHGDFRVDVPRLEG